MACFLVPATEAIVTTAAEKITKKSGKTGVFTSRLNWLNNMLWGGSALLAFEHVWHGEVVPFFPFLTNAADPASAAEMLHEMATAGVGMAVLVTAAWAGIAVAAGMIEKRTAPDSEAAK